MALRRARSLTLNGVAFRWTVRSAPKRIQRDDGTALILARTHFVAQSASGRGAKLTAQSGDFAMPWRLIPGETGGRAAFTPAMARALIKAAISTGWTPETAGPAFQCAFRIDAAGRARLV